MTVSLTIRYSMKKILLMKIQRLLATIAISMIC